MAFKYALCEILQRGWLWLLKLGRHYQ